MANILPSNPRTAVLVVLLCSMLLVAVPGCSGCFSSSTAKTKKDDKDKEKEKPKPDFQVGRLRIQPSDDTSLSKNAVKSGHWTVTTQQLLANNYDFPGELYAAAVDRTGRPLRVEATPYQMTVSTPAGLPKAEPRNYELTYYVPPIISPDTRSSSAAWLHSQLRARRGGREVSDTMQPTTTMPAYQYYLVVLAQDPSKYTGLKRLDTVLPPSSELDDQPDIVYYRVLLPNVERGAPLPSHAMAWTSIATLVWDGMDPNLMTPYQQDALLDWLHFGGQILISGPASLDKLRGSFLDAYLPADKTKAIDLDQSAVAELNQKWSLENKQTGKREDIQLEKPLVGVELKIREEGQAIVGTGDLAAERMIGRGRIVVTGFPLGDRKLKNWECYDSFLHNALLRRPRRQFVKLPNDGSIKARYYLAGSYDSDPRLSTNLRFFSRDVQNLPKVGAGVAPAARAEARYGMPNDTWHFGGYSGWGDSGMAGWNDRSGAATAARDSLKRAAGITIPSGAFVFKVLVIYLVFLVPINWGVFRLIGRVEWAWIAAPIIAIIGSIAVVRLAQLDIGFARARTEVAVLELHGGYKRGHLTRYTALYTSLSTTYDFVFDDLSAVAQPFAANLNYVHSQHDTTYTVNYRRDKEVTLAGFTVPSNSTGMVHSEHMFTLDGPVAIGGDEKSGLQLKNDSQIAIHEVGLLRQTESGMEAAYVGELPAMSAAPLTFRAIANPQDKTELPIEQWRNSTMFGARKTQAGEMSLSGVAALGANGLQLGPGDMRMIGWTDAELPGAAIRPAARQSQVRTLVLVHLKQGELPDPEPDTNLRADFEERRTVRDDDGEKGPDDPENENESGQAQSRANDPSADKPDAKKPTEDKPDAKPDAGKSNADKPAAGKPAADKSDADKPAVDKPAGDKSDAAGNKPAADKPADDKPDADKPDADKPAADKPAADKPAAADDKPADDKPASDGPAEF